MKGGIVMKILLAEDHDHLREILEDYLVENGYEVKSFDNGEDAYYCFLIESFDLILLDVMMPKMDGFTLCQIFLLQLKYKKLIN